jgi:hypothetical protein
MKTSGFLNVIGSDLDQGNIIGQEKTNLSRVKRGSIMLHFKKRG